MVIAGRQVHVAAQRTVFAANDQQHLGVGLVADNAIDHLHAGFLEADWRSAYCASSSKRARNSTTTVTSLPARAASMSKVDQRRIGAGAVQASA